MHAVSQSEFGRIAYKVVGHCLVVHTQLGRIFDESVYRSTIAHILKPRAVEEVCICLTHNSFEKRLYIDMVADSGCLFEFKVVSGLHQRHRGQLIQYLMLTGLRHGKSISFGGETVEHEFVNCHETSEHRRSFQLDCMRWPSSSAKGREFQDTVVDLLRDWGTGLDRGLYIDAITHFLGGSDRVQRPVDTLWSGIVVSRQKTNLVADDTGFEITCLRKSPDLASYEQHLIRFLQSTALERMYWVNIVSGTVTFVLLSK
ncbi:MAG: GxxExxY protein [Bythopirellula sp.]